jgi:hypothetical protein
LAILISSILVVTLGVLVISRGRSNLRERAELDRFHEEVKRLGGYVSQWGVDQETGAPELHVLFDGADIGDSEFERLARMPAFKHILTLKLAGTRLTDRGLDLLRPRLVTGHHLLLLQKGYSEAAGPPNFLRVPT